MHHLVDDGERCILYASYEDAANGQEEKWVSKESWADGWLRRKDEVHCITEDDAITTAHSQEHTSKALYTTTLFSPVKVHQKVCKFATK